MNCGRVVAGNLVDWRAAARPGASLVTVLATEGSAPRGAGARMVVTADAAVGSIGGGTLELRATEQARAMLAHPNGTWRVQDYPLGPLLGQCCGGRVRLMVERLGDTDWVEMLDKGIATELRNGDVARQVGDGNGVVARGSLPAAGFKFAEPDDTPRRPLMMFGAGHVGRALAGMLPGLPFDLAWFDSRAEFDTAGLVIADEDDLVACAGEARPGSAMLILTYDHALDYRLTAAALGSGAGFVGLIGSATKRARFVSRLGTDGIDTARLTCPIGAPGIVGKAPAVIAVATLAQLLALAPSC